MSDAGADAGVRLSEFLETPEGEWVHREIDGQPNDYRVDVEMTHPEGGTVIVRTDAGTIRYLVNATVQTIEAESED
jgi:hypothetical protein